MSLDVYLTNVAPSGNGSGIFVRRNGRTEEITRQEWDAAFPGREPIVVAETHSRDFSANITHNLNTMAAAAGIYHHLWRPDEIGITKASELIEPLAEGLALLRSDPERFKAFNPENGWGDYDGLVDFVSEYLDACLRNPDALVSVSR